MRQRGNDFVSYEDCQEFVCGLGIQSSKQWRKWCQENKRPTNIPAQPNNFYDEWVNWGTFLKTGILACKDWEFLSFEEAREIARAQNFRSKIDWDNWKERPSNIPSTPSNRYKETGWHSWHDFLGYRSRASYGESCIASFLETNKIAYKQQVKFDGCKSELKLSFDFGIYKNDKLVGLIEFQGQQHYKSVEHWGGEEIFEKHQKRDAIKQQFCELERIPLLVISYEEFENLHVLLAKFLGKIFDMEEFIMDSKTNTEAFKNWMEFDETRDYIRSLNFKSVAEFSKWVHSGERHPLIPQCPDIVYRKLGWTSFSDFLGTGVLATYARKYIPYEKCKQIAQEQGIKCQREWIEYVKNNNLSNEVPSYPNDVYKEWENWQSFLNLYFVSYEECRNFARTLNLKSKEEWCQYSKSGLRPTNIPGDPSDTYDRDEWISWGDFLGNTPGLASRNKEFLDYEEARKLVRSLGLTTAVEYTKIPRATKCELRIPGCPSDYYGTRSCWISWGDYLGNKTKFLDYEEAKKLVKTLGIKTLEEYANLSKDTKYKLKLPSCACEYYSARGCWLDCYDFFGKEK
jgi:hypothetical protein